MNSSDDPKPAASSIPPARVPKRRGPIRRLLGLAFRTTRNLLALVMLGCILLVATPMGNWLYDSLSVATYDIPKADAILCLGGGYGREARAATLWHSHCAPIVVVSNKPHAADYMARLVEQAGVPRDRILIDSTSFTTHDHPNGIGRLPGIDREHQRFIIVTDAPHSRRARACFLRDGYQHITCWAGFKATPGESYLGHCEWRIYNLPPMIYEAAALIKYKWQGKL